MIDGLIQPFIDLDPLCEWSAGPAPTQTPGHHPTNFSWGDDDWKSMYITNIGSVVRTRFNIAGLPSR